MNCSEAKWWAPSWILLSSQYYEKLSYHLCRSRGLCRLLSMDTHPHAWFFKDLNSSTTPVILPGLRLFCWVIWNSFLILECYPQDILLRPLCISFTFFWLHLQTSIVWKGVLRFSLKSWGLGLVNQIYNFGTPIKQWRVTRVLRFKQDPLRKI